MTEDGTAKPRVVLARPRIGENIGFIVRLCANFGISELVLVAPAEGWREAAERPASMCLERLREVRVVPDLETALADCSHTWGLTARAGRDRPVRRLQQMSPPASGRTALVFGNEESGLDAREAALCNELFSVQLPGLTSLNLSHAVSVALYEWSRSEPAKSESYVAAMTLEERRRLADHALSTLGSIGFPVEHAHYEQMMRRLVVGGTIETRDGRMVHRLLRHLDYLREHPEKWRE